MSLELAPGEVGGPGTSDGTEGKDSISTPIRETSSSAIDDSCAVAYSLVACKLECKISI